MNRVMTTRNAKIATTLIRTSQIGSSARSLAVSPISAA
jgi:hypothetical protein